MNNVYFHRLVFIFCIVVLFSCKKDSEILPCTTAWATDLQQELSAVSTAVALYAGDQSAANCTALKAAYQDYINAMKPYGDCATLTGQNRTEWQAALDEAEANIDTLC